MAEVKLARRRIEPGKETRLRSWFDGLADRESDVVETLEHEGVYTETAFVGAVDGATYLYLYMEAERLDAAEAAGDEERYEIDEQHHAVLQETLAGEWEELDTIGHFVNPSLR